MHQSLRVALLKISCLCGIIAPAFAIPTLPQNLCVPGGIVIINLKLTSNEPPIVHYKGSRTLVMEDPKKPNNWITVIGIPLDASVGTNHIEIMNNINISEQSFTVKDKKYPVERLTIPEKRKVEPLAEDLAIIEAEYIETIQTYAQWEYKKLKSLALAMPVKGRKSSPFGLSRIMNNITKSPHSGLDIAAPIGAKVKCAKDGQVINIGNFFYSGNIVFVDHGQGFITSYCHLNTVRVKKGQLIRQGDIIGTVGKTGRATGPHLHWSVSLNGIRVDPQLFIYE